MNLKVFLYIFLFAVQYAGPPKMHADELGQRLQAAIAKEDLEAVKGLVNKIDDIDSVKNWVGTPLHNAAFGKSLDIIKVLIENGADINSRNNEGQTPLHFAAYVASLEILKFFVEDKKINLNLADNEGREPVHYAASKGSHRAVIYLVTHGANANAIDSNGVTPLHEAAISGSLPLVKYLCESQKAELNAIDKRHGFSPLLWAAMSKSTDVAFYLIDSGSDLDLRDYRGNTILHIASFSGSINIVRYLVEEKNVKINLKNNENLRPVDLANEKQNGEIVKYLLEHKRK